MTDPTETSSSPAMFSQLDQPGAPRNTAPPMMAKKAKTTIRPTKDPAFGRLPRAPIDTPVGRPISGIGIWHSQCTG